MLRFEAAIRRRVRRFGPLAWRDAVIFNLRQELRELRGDLEDAHKALEEKAAEDEGTRSRMRRKLLRQPSFYYKAHEARRIREYLRTDGVREPIWNVNRKDVAYEFASSYGISTPKILGRYGDVSEIAWEELPDEFVVKTVWGAAGRGVLPLKGSVEGYVDLLGGERRLSRPEIVRHFEQLAEVGRVGGDVLVEELLPSPYGDGRVLPVDMKLDCFYGEVALLRARDARGDRRAEASVRYFTPDGEDLDQVMDDRKVDQTLPEPLHMDKLVAAGRTLSRALPVPFVRLDFYETVDDIVFGEITPAPGHDLFPRRDMDLLLGKKWEAAQSRIWAEAIADGVGMPRWGESNAAKCASPD